MLAVFAEVDRSIGTGHLVEALQLTACARAGRLPPVLVVPPHAPPALVAQASCPVETIDGFRRDDLARCARQLYRAGVRAALTDLRCVGEGQLTALGDGGLTPYCIDEMGGRSLSGAAVFNPTLVEERHRYTGDRGLRVYAGPAYRPLAAAYRRHHARERRFEASLRSVIVSMGGLDRTGATLRIVDALDAWTADVERHLVVGAAFAWRAELAARLAVARHQWRCHEGLPCLADLLAAADVAITAGGDTLYELACVGTPAIVLHEDPHEAEQARAFEARGFGTWLGRGTGVEPHALVHALEQLRRPALRRVQSSAGRAIVDGRGAQRICGVIRRDLAPDSPEADRELAVTA